MSDSGTAETGLIPAKWHVGWSQKNMSSAWMILGVGTSITLVAIKFGRGPKNQTDPPAHNFVG